MTLLLVYISRCHCSKFYSPILLPRCPSQNEANQTFSLRLNTCHYNWTNRTQKSHEWKIIWLFLTDLICLRHSFHFRYVYQLSVLIVIRIYTINMIYNMNELWTSLFAIILMINNLHTANMLSFNDTEFRHSQPLDHVYNNLVLHKEIYWVRKWNALDRILTGILNVLV